MPLGMMPIADHPAADTAGADRHALSTRTADGRIFAYNADARRNAWLDCRDFAASRTSGMDMTDDAPNYVIEQR